MSKKISINGETKIYGLLGYPVSHSLSPLLHNTAFASTKENASYLCFPLEKPKESTAQALLDIGIQGLSVTIPHKTWAYQTGVTQDTLSQRCQASNTLLRKEDQWHAYNTDGPGALEALRKYTKIENKNILLLGYGGSAKAIAHALCIEENIRSLAIAGRNTKKRDALIRQLQSNYSKKNIFPSNLDIKEAERINIIIHATPLGMLGYPQELPLPSSFLLKKHVIFDIVYNPQKTILVQEAKKKGALLVPGYLMLLYQACLQFEYFTKKLAPKSLLEKTLKKTI